MSQPHVVILESRRFPDITEQWYNVAVSALTQQAITFSRVTVPHSADLPIAFRMLLDAAHHSEADNLRSPDGYLVLGLDYKGDVAEQSHFLIWEKLLHLATTAGVPFSNVLLLENDRGNVDQVSHAHTAKINLAVQSLVNLLMLRYQLFNPPHSYSLAA